MMNTVAPGKATGANSPKIAEAQLRSRKVDSSYMDKRKAEQSGVRIIKGSASTVALQVGGRWGTLPTGMATSAPAPGEITLLLQRVQEGDSQALADLAPLVGWELRRLAARSLRRMPPGHTWQPTDLVHELWLRFLARNQLHFENRPHFLAVAAHLMRGIVIDHVRRRCALKRMPEVPPEASNEFETLLGLTDSHAVELVSLDDALNRLAVMRPRQAEIVEMRYFGGCTVEETAEVLEISAKTVKREWAAARAGLHAELRGIDA